MIIPGTTHGKGRGAGLKFVVALVLAGAPAGAALPAPASVLPVSAGCQALNTPTLDSTYSASTQFTSTFLAGEQLTVSAVAVPGSTATAFTIAVNGSDLLTVNSLPGTATYTFPSSGTFTVQWQSLPLPPGMLTWTVTCAPAVGATFRGLSATGTSRGVLVRWRTAAEVDVLGFNVYRAGQGKRVRVNVRLIPAHGASAYSFLDRKAPQRRVLRYWVQLVSRDGSRAWYGPTRIART